MSSPIDMQPEDDKKKNINGHCKNSPIATNIMSQKRRSENGCSEAQDVEGKTTLNKSNLGRKASNIISISINAISFIVLILLFVLFKKNAVTPFRRGFFCSDVSIRYPVREDTVSTTSLVISSVLIFIFVVFVGEYMFGLKESPAITNLKTGSKPIHWIKVYLSPRKWFFRALKFFFIYLWALLASQVLVNILKHSIGTLRPNFYALCNPNIKCNNKSDPFLYHTEYVCQDISPKEEASLRTSFPSGHSAFSATAALFLVVYIQKKMNKPTSITFCGTEKVLDTFVVLVGPSLQFVCFGLSCWTSLLRVSDYKHHLLDVIVGYILGGIIGFVAAYHSLGWDSINRNQNNSHSDINDRSCNSVQELVEMNEAQDNEIRKEEDVEKDIMEYENEPNVGNVNLTRQSTTVTTGSE